MKSFLKYLSSLTFISICLAILLYSLALVFFHEYHKRSKVDVSNSKANVVFFGSSRCVNTVIPDVFDSIAGTDSYNMGWAAAGPREIYAAVKLYLKRNTSPKFAFIQVDLSHDITSPSDLAKQSLLKYYFTGEIEDYFDDSIKMQMCMPLLPNILNRDFGWREILKTLVVNKNVTAALRGYSPIYGELQLEEMNQNTFGLENIADQQNIWISKSIELLQKSGVEVFLFTSPYFNFSQKAKLNNLKVYNLTYFNFSNSISSGEYFKDYSHVNNAGARLLTDSLAERFKSFINYRK